MIVVGKFEKVFISSGYVLKFQEKSANFKELAQKLQELWTITLGGGVAKDPLARIGLINTQMKNFSTPGESCIANSLPLVQSKVVNPPPYHGVSLDSPIIICNNLKYDLPFYFSLKKISPATG